MKIRKNNFRFVSTGHYTLAGKIIWIWQRSGTPEPSVSSVCLKYAARSRITARLLEDNQK
jgi:hypothetical protein